MAYMNEDQKKRANRAWERVRRGDRFLISLDFPFFHYAKGLEDWQRWCEQYISAIRDDALQLKKIETVEDNLIQEAVDRWGDDLYCIFTDDKGERH